jgi:hypothetical protein
MDIIVYDEKISHDEENVLITCHFFFVHNIFSSFIVKQKKGKKKKPKIYINYNE